MTNTKKALFASVVSVLLCVSMLVGSTFAWFTDTDTVATSNIVAGTLDIEIVDENGNELSTLDFVNANKEADILWEPGATFKTVGFKFVNKGNLSLKYKVQLNNTEVSYNKLNEAIDFTLVNKNGDEIALTALVDQKLDPKGESDVMYIKGTMKADAGNEYQGLTLSSVSITVYATQISEEVDSKDNTYDAGAEYDDNVVLVGTADEFIAAFNALRTGKARAATTKQTIITLTNDIDMTGKAWTPVNNKGFTLNGNEHTVTGLANGLVGHTASGEFTIKNITFDKMTVTNSYENDTYSYAGLIGDADTCSYILMENVTISNSTINSTKGNEGYAAGFVAYTSGYGNDNDGAVNASHNFINCTLINTTVNGTSSAGGLIGHCGGNDATKTNIKGTKIIGSNIKGEKNAKDGYILGTAHVGVITIDKVDDLTLDIGRFLPGTTGKLIINGVEQTEFTNDADAPQIKYEQVAGESVAETQTNLNTAISGADNVVAVLPQGSYTIPALTNKDVTIVGDKDTVIDTVTSKPETTGAAINFEGVTINFKEGGMYGSNGFTHSEKVVYKDCTITGTQFLYSEAEFINCTFEVKGDAYAVWTYGSAKATFTDCTFNTSGKAVLVYTEGNFTAEHTFTNCIFNDDNTLKEDDGVTDLKKGAIEIGESANGAQANYTIHINNCTANGFSAENKGTPTNSALWGNKNSIPADRLNVIIDGTEVY